VQVVDAVAERDLRGRQAEADPVGGDVVEVIEVNAARWRGCANPRRRRRGPGEMSQLVVLRLVGEGDERGEAVRFVLQLAQAAQVVDAVRHGLDVAVEHGAGAALAHLVPGAMDLEPFLGAFLAAANLVADAGSKISAPPPVSELRPASRRISSVSRIGFFAMRSARCRISMAVKALTVRFGQAALSALDHLDVVGKGAAWDGVRRRCGPR
jgi:hypothetical protein